MHFKDLAINLAILSISTTVLVGCQIDNEVALSQQSVTPHKPPNDATHSSKSNCTEHIVLSTVGVGGITARTPASLEELSTALTCFHIEKKTGSSEGVTYPYFSASRDGVLQLNIIPKANSKRLHSVVIIGKQVRSTLGHPMGSLFHKVYPSDNATSCQPGLEELSGTVVCTAPTAQNIVYLFSGLWHGPDGEMPPMDVLNMWTLVQISWSPGGDK